VNRRSWRSDRPQILRIQLLISRSMIFRSSPIPGTLWAPHLLLGGAAAEI
jgi:hypothetical protein